MDARDTVPSVIIRCGRSPAQFRSLTGELEHYAEDPYTPVEGHCPKPVRGSAR